MVGWPYTEHVLTVYRWVYIAWCGEKTDKSAQYSFSRISVFSWISAVEKNGLYEKVYGRYLKLFIKLFCNDNVNPCDVLY